MKHIQVKVTDELYNRAALFAMTKGLKLQTLLSKALVYYMNMREVGELSEEVALNALIGEGNKNEGGH
jgi:hypothetical protein